MIGVEELKRGSEKRERGTAQDAAVAEGSASASERERGLSVGEGRRRRRMGAKANAVACPNGSCPENAHRK